MKIGTWTRLSSMFVRFILAAGLDNMVEKWNAPGCPHYKLLFVASRLIKGHRKAGLKTTGLDDEDVDEIECDVTYF